MDTKQKHIIKKFLRELSKVRGRHTELVSVYVPAGYDLNKIIQHIQQEQGTASNIKDARTRKNVMDSLEKVIRHLRLYKKTPENGLAVFAGNASDDPSKIDIKIWSFEPPEPLNFRLYRCDQTFYLEPLKNLLESKEVYGLIVLDRREANIGILKGTAVIELMKMTSGVPGKFKTGGQSAQRFARIREGLAHEFYKRVGEASNKQFLEPLEKKELKGVLIGGPGHTKNEFFDGDFLNNEVKRRVLGLKDLGYTGEFGLHELIEKSQDLLAQEEIMKEKKLMQRFFELLAKEPDKISYGTNEVERVLEMGAVEVLLLSDSLEDEIIEKFEYKSGELGTETVIISADTGEGIQLKELGGVAAILRYRVSL